MDRPRQIRRIVLTPEERTTLRELLVRGPKPYLRERAAALLKVAAGTPALYVARSGLLLPRRCETVCTWIDRYEEKGLAGLWIIPGRGRKPAFSPSVPNARREARRGSGKGSAPAGSPTGSALLRD